MNSEMFTQIILCIITILGAVVSYFIVPLLKEKMGEIKYNQFMDFIYRLVRAANQIYDSNYEKKEFVRNQALAWLKANDVNLTEEQINAIIEGFVNEVKRIDNSNN